VTIRALLSSADGSDREVDLRDESIPRIEKNQLLWVDITGDDTNELDSVRDALDYGDDVADALRSDVRRPDATVLEGAHELTLLWIDNEEDDDPVPIQVLAGDRWVITRHPQPLERLERERENITDQREIGSLRPVEFVVAILDWHLDGFFGVAAQLERLVDQLDEEALSTDRDLLDRLVAIRRRIARARRIAARHSDVYAEIA
jgi:Mg2+ and Co2+ transporter CorA